MAVGIGILGGGIVGGSLARRLLDDRAAILAKTGLDLELIRIAVRDPAKERLFPTSFATTNTESVVDDPDVDLVVELIGGRQQASPLVRRALAAGKPVVTANKELLAAEGPELFELAAGKGVSLLFEAAVGGGIPLIRPLTESLAGEKLSRVLGIVNGTTNYILTAMTESGASYEDALAEAQRLGYAEADPSADVGGGDAAAKAVILGGLAFGVWVGADGVHREGIEGLESAEIGFAAQLGYVIKLLATAEALGGGISVRVHPALVPMSHPLASIRGATNAVFVEGPAIGQLLFSGPGAGGEPTATAVLGDIIDAARELLAGAQVTPRVIIGSGAAVTMAKVASRFYLRLEVSDSPGVLAAIAGIFGESGVSIASVRQDGQGDQATLILVTHEATESAHQRAVDQLRHLSSVNKVAATIRVLHPIDGGLMRFISTRGHDPGLGFDDLLLGGVAADGGLLVPDEWPQVDAAATYEGAVAEALKPFAGGSVVVDQLEEIVTEAFASFRSPEVLPLRPLADGRQLLELFWGPTLAFKDHALQVMGQLLTRVLESRGAIMTALVATSGDTGAAAIAAGAGQPNLNVVVLFPEGRVSGFQRKQMTTVSDPNVSAVAVKGNFDDCQDLVKRAFADPAFTGQFLAMNSINLVRILVQTAYFRHIADKLPGVDFVVPSGNFGNVFAAWAAKQMGAPIGELVLASNANHGLSDFVNHGNIDLEPVVPTLASAMDIQIPSNLERYLFELSGRDPNRVIAWQEELRSLGKLQLEPIDRSRVENDFSAGWIDDASVRSTMAQAYQSDELLIDPHTAVAWKVGEDHRRPGQEQVVLAPADPIKFGAAVAEATGVEPALPAGAAHVLTDPEHLLTMANDYEALVKLLANYAD